MPQVGLAGGHPRGADPLPPPRGDDAWGLNAQEAVLSIYSDARAGIAAGKTPESYGLPPLPEPRVGCEYSWREGVTLRRMYLTGVEDGCLGTCLLALAAIQDCGEPDMKFSMYMADYYWPKHPLERQRLDTMLGQINA